jgi:YidC/Oxa1 family membrane protein insertase
VTLPLASVLQPLEDAAEWLLLKLHDDVGFGWGMAIIGMTVLVRLAILPLTIKGIRSMNALRALQPQMKEIQEKYKDDRQRMNQEMMKFYKENQVNPLGSCLPLLLQLPVFLALFRLLRSQEFADKVHADPPTGWLFIPDLTEKATGATLVVLIILYVGSQMGASLVMSATADKTQQRIFLLLPLAFAVVIPSFPAGLILYWITTNFWTFGQQVVVRKVAPPPHLAQPAVAAAAVGGGGDLKKPPPPPRKKKRRRR